MNLTKEERVAMTQYRIERALESLVEAQDNAASALLLSNAITPTTHAGVNRMMHLHYVRTGRLTRNEGKLLNDLFSMRQTGDYDDIFDWTQDQVEPIIPETKALVEKIISIIDISE